jgi:hypothetical protein
MADASIIVAIIALVAALATAVIASLTSCSLDLSKTRRETEKLVSHYRDPLLLASLDLQSRLYNILARKLFAHYPRGLRK